jgi:hypothetical protein
MTTITMIYGAGKLACAFASGNEHVYANAMRESVMSSDMQRIANSKIHLTQAEREKSISGFSSQSLVISVTRERERVDGANEQRKIIIATRVDLNATPLAHPMYIL